MADTTLSRRNILILAGVAVATSALPLSVSMTQPEQLGLENSLRGVMTDLQALAVIGHRWLAQDGEQTNVAALSRRITKKLRAQGWAPDASTEDTRAAMAKTVRADFARDDMVLVDNWALSRTGAELCALAALMAESGPKDVEEGAGAAPHG